MATQHCCRKYPTKCSSKYFTSQVTLAQTLTLTQSLTLILTTLGPNAFTASIQEVMDEKGADTPPHRIFVKANFKDVGAKHWQKRTYLHVIKEYINEHSGRTPRLLKYYHPITPLEHVL
jgi:hypothetical protein